MNESSNQVDVELVRLMRELQQDFERRRPGPPPWEEDLRAMARNVADLLDRTRDPMLRIALRELPAFSLLTTQDIWRAIDQRLIGAAG